MEKIEKITGYIDHTGILVHNDHAAGTHHGSDLGQFIEINAQI